MTFIGAALIDPLGESMRCPERISGRRHDTVAQPSKQSFGRCIQQLRDDHPSRQRTHRQHESPEGEYEAFTDRGRDRGQ